MKKSLSVIIPVFNEEESIFINTKTLNEKLNNLVKNKTISKFEFILVDDGSTDNSWNEIIKLTKNKISIIALRFTKNFGHQSALIAGLNEATNEMLLTIDAICR